MIETRPSIDPKTTALLVMDYQPAILDMLGDSDAPGTAVHGDIAPLSGDIVVRKTRVGAFSTTDLDRQLKERGIVTRLLAGITTRGVVISTVRDAADRDYQVFVLADACADREPAVHEFLIGKVLPTQAHVLRVADLGWLLSAPAAPNI